MKFEDFFKRLSKKFKCDYKLTRKPGTIQRPVYIYDNISLNSSKNEQTYH